MAEAAPRMGDIKIEHLCVRMGELFCARSGTFRGYNIGPISVKLVFPGTVNLFASV